MATKVNATGIKFTASAVKELKKAIADQQLPAEVAVRIGVTGGGCSGFEYKLGFDENINEGTDMVSVLDGLRVAVDKKKRFVSGRPRAGLSGQHRETRFRFLQPKRH